MGELGIFAFRLQLLQIVFPSNHEKNILILPETLNSLLCEKKCPASHLS